jgi:hypothetical protein
MSQSQIRGSKYFFLQLLKIIIQTRFFLRQSFIINEIIASSLKSEVMLLYNLSKLNNTLL